MGTRAGYLYYTFLPENIAYNFELLYIFESLSVMNNGQGKDPEREVACALLD